MATSIPSPLWSDINFIENGELGQEAVLNRPNHTLDDKAQWLRSTLELHISEASCFASKIGETLGSDCSTGSCLPCWGSPNFFDANDSYKSAISKLDAIIKVSNDSVISLALAEDVFETYTGIPTNTPVSTFAGHSFIDGLTHRQALSTFDDVVAANSDILVSHASTLSVYENSILANSSGIVVLQTDVATLSALTDANVASIAINESRIDAHDSTITDTILVSQASLDVNVSTLNSQMAATLSTINCITDHVDHSLCSIV